MRPLVAALAALVATGPLPDPSARAQPLPGSSAAAPAPRERAPAPGHRGYYEGPPDVAIEVLSPGDTAADMRGRIENYLDAGARLVLVVDPDRKRVMSCRRPTATWKAYAVSAVIAAIVMNDRGPYQAVMSRVSGTRRTM